MLIEVGRIVIKTNGRKTLLKGVIVDIIDQNYVLVTGPFELTGLKRKRQNIKHIEPTNKLLKIKREASYAEVMKAIKAQNLTDFMKS